MTSLSSGASLSDVRAHVRATHAFSWVRAILGQMCHNSEPSSPELTTVVGTTSIVQQASRRALQLPCWRNTEPD